MFQGWVPDGIESLLQHLENQLPMLSEDDQAFVLGAKLTLEMTGLLDKTSIERLRQIGARHTHASHNGIGNTQALSITQIFKDLASSAKILTPQQRQFAEAVATKFKKRIPLTAEEVQGLFRLHAEQGF